MNSEQSEYTKKIMIRMIEEILTPNQKQVIIYYYFKQMNTVEIATLLNKNKSTVCRTKQAAEKKLSRYLSLII